MSVHIMNTTLKENNVNIKEKQMATISRVRRCLFGRPEKDSLKAEKEKMFAKESEEAKLKWNYDIIRDVPLPGDLEWISTSDVPEFYRKGYTSKFRQVMQRVPCNSVEKEYTDESDDDDLHGISPLSADDNVDCTSSLNNTVCNKTDSTVSTGPVKPKLVQTQVDEFLRKRKRSLQPTDSASKTRRLE